VSRRDLASLDGGSQQMNRELAGSMKEEAVSLHYS
jgi:hypothetical protein